MVINEQTKISVLIKHHPDALEAIIALSPDFNKLRNPILRALMAGRTSIAMAAKVGGCKPEDFFAALQPLGFEIDSKTSMNTTPETSSQSIPDFLKAITPEQLITFDVRSILAEGNDPLRAIQDKVKGLKQGEVLKIINTFEPVPLIKLLERQGYQAHVDNIEPALVETYFYKTTNEAAPTLEAGSTSTGDWDQILQHFEGKLVEIDVRHLEMPKPMMTILETLETMPLENALYVHHKRIPVFLLTELKDRKFDFRIKEVAEGEVYLLIFKNA